MIGNPLQWIQEHHLGVMTNAILLFYLSNVNTQYSCLHSDSEGCNYLRCVFASMHSQKVILSRKLLLRSKVYLKINFRSVK